MLTETWTLPARLRKEWQFNINKPGNLNILVYSDNGKLDEPLLKSSSVSSYLGAGYVGFVHVSTEINAGISGRFLIRVRRIESSPLLKR